MNASIGAATGRPEVWSLIRLQRDGERPLRFIGRPLARHAGWRGSAVWHDLALYRAASGGYAVAIVALIADAAPAAARPARCHAVACASLDDALLLLEAHDAAGDLCPGVSAPAMALDDGSLSPAALAMQAAALRGACADAVRRYRIGVGAFLAGLAMQDL